MRRRKFKPEGRKPGTKIAPRAGTATLIWGAREISKRLGISEQSTFFALNSETGVPGAKRIGGRWALHLPSFEAGIPWGT